MKKILLSLAVLVGVASAAHAQETRFGVKAGVNLAKLTGYYAGDNKNLVSLAAGVMADFGVSDLLSFHPELLYSQKGSKPNTARATGQVRTSYLDLPLLLRVKADGLFFEAGPQVGLVVAQKSEIDFGNGSVVSSTSTSGVQKLDLGYIAGIGYQLPAGLELGVRYNGGLLGVNNSTVSFNGPHNSVFQLQLGYLFGGR
ncbi:MAG: PorT family protein [Bacteroidota bacterium]|nr:PorT family protein [Bacteroidota bacterium]